jgi:hypothetical protein
MYAAGMQSYLRSKGVLNKDFKTYAMEQSQTIVANAECLSQERLSMPVAYISSSGERKEALARAQQEKLGIKDGLVGVWSCVESCNTYRSTFNPQATYPELRHDQSRCKHLYYYLEDPKYGFVSIRLQTWAPYEMQVALNGREWLRRGMDNEGCGYVLNGNKYLHIDDYTLAQKLLDAQLTADFESILNGFVPLAFPAMPEMMPGMGYYWTLWQSELAADYIFDKPESLRPIMDSLLRFALVTGKGERIMQYFGAPAKQNGQPRANSNPEILSRAKCWYDGLRVRHWNGKNSLKFYNEHNVLRFEMTMNDPSKYKIHRHAENQSGSEPKQLRQIRKGIADITARAQVSGQIVDRFVKHMACAKESMSLESAIGALSKPVKKNGKRVRALDVLGKDLQLLRAIADPSLSVSSITNKGLQGILAGTDWVKGMTGKRLSGRISRHLAILRHHGLIKKLPKQNKYALTDKGRKLTSALNIVLATSLDSLLNLAA